MLVQTRMHYSPGRAEAEWVPVRRVRFGTEMVGLGELSTGGINQLVIYTCAVELPACQLTRPCIENKNTGKIQVLMYVYHWY